MQSSFTKMSAFYLAASVTHYSKVAGILREDSNGDSDVLSQRMILYCESDLKLSLWDLMFGRFLSLPNVFQSR